MNRLRKEAEAWCVEFAKKLPGSFDHEEAVRCYMAGAQRSEVEVRRLCGALLGAQMVFGGLERHTQGTPENMIFRDHLKEIKDALAPYKEWPMDRTDSYEEGGDD